MALELFTNLPTGTVTSGCTDAPAGGTSESCTVNVTTAFPVASASATPPTQFHFADIASNSEIFTATVCPGGTGSSQSWTVTRGAEGTTPVTHAAGFTIFQVTTAGAIRQASRVDWLNVVTMFGADNTGVADSTTAIQNAINAANGTPGAAVYIPAGNYLVCTGGTSITLLEGTILIGDSSGTYLHGATADAIPGVSCLVRAASANCDVLVAPAGNDYGRIRDLAIDGNKSNNTSGFGMDIEDASAAEECQWMVERCYFHDNPDSNLYIGHNRRGVRVLYSSFNYSANGDGITVCGSDALILGNICGQNTSRAGINLGSSVTQNWAAFGSNTISTLAQVLSNDTYQNLVGIAVPNAVTNSMIIGNGIDKNQYQGLTVYEGDANAIIGNAFHSNGQAADNTYAHIDLGAQVTGVVIDGNTFGPVDGGVTNLCTTCVNLESWAYTGIITGNIGNVDTTAPDTHSGIINSSTGAPPATRLSSAGATIQGSGNNVVNLYSVGDALLTTLSNGGTFTHQGGAAHFTQTGNVMGASSGPGSAILALVGNGTGNAELKTQLASGQTADIADFYASNGTTLLASISVGGAFQPGNGSAAGGHLWSGSGAPNIAASVSGDYYFRTDTPSTANQRLYVATGANTWTGIL